MGINGSLALSRLFTVLIMISFFSGLMAVQASGEHNRCGASSGRLGHDCGEHNKCGSSLTRTTDNCGERKGCSLSDTDDCNLSATLLPSNAILDSGQYESYTISVANGRGPFEIELYNITGNKQQGSNVIIGAPGNVSISFESGAAGSFAYTAIVTDLGRGQTAYSSPNSISVNEAPYVDLSTNGQYFDVGQTITFTFTVYGGRGPFEIELYNITGNKQQGSNVIIGSPGGSNTLSITAGAVGTFSFNAFATDLGTTTPYAFDPQPLSSSVI